MASEAAPLLIKVSKPRPEQDEGRDSFVGGRPKLPPGEPLPVCRNCGAILTFFFQIAFPDGQPWAGQTLAVFACTACQDEVNPVPMVNKNVIPSMRRMDLRPGEDVPDGALDLYQRTCRLLVFPTGQGVVRNDYSERVRYRAITFERPTDDRATAKSKLGGRPAWVDAKLTPGRYIGEPLIFLFQWRHDFQFHRVEGSPPPYNYFAQDVPDLTADVKYYELFLGTQLYFFGNTATGRPHVFMIATRA